MSNDTAHLEPQKCQLPGCDNAVEQPATGGQRKRFCCDAHRLQFWRQTRSGGPVADVSSRATENSASLSPALALRSQIALSVQSLEGVLARARTTLIELSDLEEAEAVRAESQSLASEMVAKAQGERAAEERRRRAAENLAEAASKAAQEAEDEASRALQERDQALAEAATLREALAALEKTTEEQLATTQEQAALAIQDAQEEARQAKAAQTGAEAQAHQLREELDRLRHSLQEATDKIATVEQKLDAETEHHRRELAAALERQDRAQDRLQKALDDLMTLTESRAKAQSQAEAAEKRIEELRQQLGQRDTGKKR